MTVTIRQFDLLLCTTVLLLAVPFAVGANAHENPIVGTWKLKLDWGEEKFGEQVLSVNSDLTGTLKDLEDGWTVELRDVESEGETAKFTFLVDGAKGYETEFKGTVVGKEITGAFIIKGSRAAVFGVPLSEKEMLATLAKKSVADYYQARSFTSSEGITLPYRLFVPPEYDPDKKFPLVLFHHGGGGTGSDNRRNLESACIREWILPEAQSKNPCFIVAPQFPGKETFLKREKELGSMYINLIFRAIHEMLDSLEEEFSIDKSREYVTGLSFGGECVWMSITERPHRFAAAVSICATSGISDLAADERGKKVAKLPVWIFHGDADDTVSVEKSRDMVRALQDAGGDPKYTEYPGVGHYTWDMVYRDPKLITWLFAQSRRQE